MGASYCDRHSRFAAAVAAMLLLDYPLGATVVPRLRLEDLAKEAEIVVQGRVLRHHSAWDAAGRFIWTHYEIAVTDAIKGSPLRVVTVSEPGGVVGSIGMQIAGVTRYADGEEVIVFLHRTPFGRWRTYGYGQGKFSVMPLARGGKTVRTNIAGVLLVDPSASRGPRRMTSESPLQRLDGMELEEFKTRVRRAVTLGAR